MVDSTLDEIDSGVRSNFGRGEVAQPIPPKSEIPIKTSKSLLCQRGMSFLRNCVSSDAALDASTGDSTGGVFAFKSGGTWFWLTLN